jgi:hypothetical protein
MRRLTKASVLTGLLGSFLLAALFVEATPKKEYFTEDELDLLRDAQELGARVSTYFKLADRRLIFLGIKEKSQEQIEKERKEREKRIKEQKKSTDTKATANKAPIDDTSYLDDFTHAELLRGYIQALDEVTDNIDNAFTSRQDVRDPLEDLSKFTREALPLLEKYKPKNDSEKAALQDAIDRSKEIAAQTKEALTQVPKTEKKRK